MTLQQILDMTDNYTIVAVYRYDSMHRECFLPAKYCDRAILGNLLNHKVGLIGSGWDEDQQVECMIIELAKD